MAIFITDIKIVNSDRNIIERFIMHPEAQSVVIPVEDKDGYFKQVEIKREHIRGRSFRNRYGEDVVIGMSKEVQEALGLPFEDFESMSETITYQLNRIFALQGTINKLNSMTLWDRIKFVFKGYNK